jgi:DNA-directed RNA polymerase II subunit RPB1
MIKRKLFQSEIDSILEAIQPLPHFPPLIGGTIAQTQRTCIRKQLQKIVVHPHLLQNLKDRIEKAYYTGYVQPGENCGIHAAQTIGEKTTQLVLNAFHLSGAGEKMTTTGLPKLTELLSATQDPKHQSLRIYFTKTFKTVQQLRETVWPVLPHTTVKDLIESCVVRSRTEEKGVTDLEWYQDFEIASGFSLIYLPEWYLDITLDLRKISKSHIEVGFIAQRLESTFSNVRVIYSPASIGKLHIYVDDVNLSCRKETVAHLKHVVRHEVLATTVSGLKGIEAFPVKEKGLTRDGDHWIVETNGGSLVDVMGHPLVDPYLTTSDNMWQIFETLGCEATRAFLIEEFTKVVSAEGDIGVRHISLMVDMMLSHGTISPNNRHGMEREQIGALGKGAFEETDKNLAISAIFGEVDDLSGITANTIMGKIAKTGTGLVDVRMDFEKMSKISKDRLQKRELLQIENSKKVKEPEFVTY